MELIVETEIGLVAANLGKSENSRIAAGQQFKRIVDYVRDPDTDGAQQIIALGYEPTVAGIWRAVTANKHYPKTLGKSFSTGERVLQIGRADDPEVELRRQQEADNERKRNVREPLGSRGETLQTDFDPCEVDENQWTGLPSTHVIEPEPDPLHANSLRRIKLTMEQHKQDIRNSLTEAKVNGLTRQEALVLFNSVYPLERAAPSPKPAPVYSTRVQKAVELFFASERQLWLRQRMADPQPTIFKVEGPHIEWIKTYYACEPAEQQAIKEAIETETSRRAAWISPVPARRRVFRPAIRAGPLRTRGRLDKRCRMIEYDTVLLRQAARRPATLRHPSAGEMV